MNSIGELFSLDVRTDYHAGAAVTGSTTRNTPLLRDGVQIIFIQ
jgi:hypothetical protein